MSTTERAGGAVQAVGKATSGELLEAIRASHVEGRIRQMRQLDAIEAACLIVAGGALGTMAAACAASGNNFYELCGAGAFLLGLVVGITGVCQRIWPPSAKEIKRLLEAENHRSGNGPPPLKP